ncbi:MULTISPECIES: putative protein N(5)-glutamine methyltransferase [Pseudonocardia]|uniref:peptide chain release factor N(5)-glutamine methyltransferase n=2 Tax=Pseudonocardia TaxID=1847 RepID=A0A1Y2N4X5_PSEAH|nr:MULTISPECIES: putative protein N(5)-glutamine methyltransferase [Pseudonocardia]OSY42496.1 Release factor glutamine methyltransferase [Pseudonocardia autotrophica]TDN76015.1 release factor glutamine methyltransferase [Pseudonocardia autotrophica]BBF99991.1 methylase [Pseudonocardia autotrophica]GEC25051.1 methylase [Pseudonocardia saturnea]
MDRVSAPLAARLRAAGCVFAEEEAALLEAAASGAELDRLVRRRIAGEPLEHLLGHVRFDGLRIRVATGVFVPRRRSEALVHAAVRGLRPGAVVVDLCCGCGAIGLAIARRAPVVLHAVDVDPVATACAAGNLAGTGTVHTGDLFAALPESLRGRVDVVVANTPYVPAAEITGLPPEARDHEPRTALDGGADGLDPARRVAAAACGWLARGGRVLIETSSDQAPALEAAFEGAGLASRTGHDEERDGTWVEGTLPH